MKEFSVAARVYIAATVVIGLGVLGMELPFWQSTGVARYLVYFLAFLLASGLKIKLPGAVAAMSMNQVLVLVGIIELSLPETLLMASTGALIEASWSAPARSRLVRSLFNISCTAIAVTVAYRVYHSGLYSMSGSSTALMVIAAAGVLFVCNTLSVAMVIKLTEGKSLVAVWRESYLWSLAHYLVAASIAALWTASTKYFGWQTSVLMLPTLFVIYRSYNLQLKRTETEKKHAQEMADLHLKTIEALAAAIEAKDYTTHDHLERVQVYAINLGKKMNLTGGELQALRVASILHDIGKLAVPEYIISKPGKLTQEEFEKMKIHPVVGAQILERVRFPYPVAPIVRHHHEKWDGTGYPDGLKGEQIPIAARILSVVDSLDALASDRQYRRALPLEKAMAVVADKAGKSYDPEIVKILQHHYQEWERMARRRSPSVAKIITNIQVHRGEAPDTGFEQARVRSQPPAEKQENKGQDFPSLTGTTQRQEQALYELSRILGFSHNLTDTWAILDAGLRSMIPYDTICVFARENDRLRAKFVRGENTALFRTLLVPIGEGLTGWVAENRKPIINGNPSVEASAATDRARFATLQSALAVPLEGSMGNVGVLSLYHSAANAFTRDDLRILLALAPKVSSVLENAAGKQPATTTTTMDLIALAGRTEQPAAETSTVPSDSGSGPPA